MLNEPKEQAKQKENTPTVTESDRIYHDYYHAIRLMNRNESRYGRNTSYHEYQASVAVASKYSLQRIDVLSVIRAEDTIQNEIKFEIEAKEITEENRNNTVCPECNEIIANNDDDELRVRVDPLQKEVYSNLEPLYSCYGCYLEVSYQV